MTFSHGNPVPTDRWNYTEKSSPLTQTDPNDDYAPWIWTDDIDAPDALTAEQRVFAVIAYDYDDPASDYTYSAETEVSPGRWRVRVTTPPDG